jgi:hypothetical protein
MPVIKYDTSNGVRERQVTSSEISYEEDSHHWRVKTGEQKGKNIYQLIPRERVYAVKMIGQTTGSVVTRTE